MAEGAYVWKLMANGKEVEIGKWLKAQCPGRHYTKKRYANLYNQKIPVIFAA